MFLIFGLLQVSLIPLFAKGKEIEVEKVMALVNGDIILLSDIQDRLKETHPDYSSSSAEKKASLEKEMLEMLIDESLIQQATETMDLEVSEKLLNQQIEQILSKNKITISQLEKFLNSNDTTLAEYREEMRKKLLTHEFIRMVIRPKVNVNDDDITAAILKNGGTKFLEYIQFHVKHIFLKNGLQAAQKMDKIYQELKSGVSFETLVKKFSEDSHTKDKGGDLGLIAKDDISSQLRKELIKLKPGVFSKPIATSTGIHILKLIKFVSKKHPEMARLRQKWEAQLTEQAIRTQLNVWVQNRRGASTIKYLN